MAKITLATLSTATAQQVFDQVRDHLLRQGKRSHLRAGHGTCAYRSHDGLQCAAGCLIGDDEYVTAMESRRWDGVVADGHAPEHHAGLIGDLQFVHDVYEPSAWESSLRREAKKRGLAWTITLATLPTASAQEVFEQAAKHLLKQNAKSVETGTENTCMYRSPEGLACAAGALMSDEDVASLPDGLNYAPWMSIVFQANAPREHAELIRVLQGVHDQHRPAEWPTKLREVARKYELDESFIDTLQPVSIRETAAA